MHSTYAVRILHFALVHCHRGARALRIDRKSMYCGQRKEKGMAFKKRAKKYVNLMNPHNVGECCVQIQKILFGRIFF